CPANAMGDGATGTQPPSFSVTLPLPFQGAAVLAFLPACASWMPGTHRCSLINAVICASFSICSSFHIPRSSGDIRPSGETAVASAITIDAPPTARPPKCTRCQSVANPSIDEYWHMGDTTMRFFNVIPLMVKGVKSIDIFIFFYIGKYTDSGI